MLLLLSPQLKSNQGSLLIQLAAGLPFSDGGPVCVSAQPELAAYRGKLLSQVPGRGRPVYAASFIRERQIILESALFLDESRLRLIFVHELAHFAWARLGNPARHAYTALLRYEADQAARGELGESSDVRKPFAPRNLACWRDYVCESFCDTAAYLYAGVPQHAWFRLAPRWTRRRAAWFQSHFLSGGTKRPISRVER